SGDNSGSDDCFNNCFHESSNLVFIIVCQRCLRFDGVILTITQKQTIQPKNKRLLPTGNSYIE
ncbi:hypothetical protein UA38_20760, partial [Photobacterium kishitanii]|uniref:hypothetical protein n=1 Tax=Photobacterium kishitanii TaxID=318456 RepID=UPI0005D31727